MQLESIKESIGHLDVIMSHCDVVFTPLLGQQAVAAKRKKSVVYGASYSTPDNSSNNSGNDTNGVMGREDNGAPQSAFSLTPGDRGVEKDKLYLFSECIDHYGWNDPKQGYITRAWCRLELFLGRFIPLSSQQISPSSEKALKYRHKLKFFCEDSPLFKAMSGCERLHVICHQKTESPNGRSAPRSHENEVCGPIVEVKDEELSDEEIVAFSGGTIMKSIEVTLSFLPPPTPMHLSFYNPVKGRVTKKDDLTVISELAYRLHSSEGVFVQPLSPNNKLSVLSNSFRLSADEAEESDDKDVFVESTALLLSNGDRYVGSTLNGFLHGENCVLNCSNGNRYSGGFVNHVKSGQGRYELVSPLMDGAGREMDKGELWPVQGSYEGECAWNIVYRIYRIPIAL